MPAYRPPVIAAREITPKNVYLSRRGFLGTAAGLAAIGLAGREAIAAPLSATAGAYKLDEKLTPLDAVTSYNNFYEFGVGKSDPKENSGKFKPNPWTVKVDGLVSKPQEFAIEDLMKYPLEERTYRMRCVEGWSMVIPWIGFPLAALLDKVEPLGSAKYVSFETVVRPEEMPGQSGLFQPLSWPYVEGLRLDEARHPLTILAVGLYGETLPNQNGAPIRLVVPGNMVSRASNPSCGSRLSRNSRKPPGKTPTPVSTASIPTSIRMSTIPAGARQRNNALAKAAFSARRTARP